MATHREPEYRITMPTLRRIEWESFGAGFVLGVAAMTAIVVWLPLIFGR